MQFLYAISLQEIAISYCICEVDLHLEMENKTWKTLL